MPGATLLENDLSWRRWVPLLPARGHFALAYGPESAYAMACGVRRIHRRQNVSMVSCTQLCAVLKGLTKTFILEHGAEV